MGATTLGTHAEVLCKELGCSLGREGHKSDFAHQRREEEGPNELYKPKPPTLFLLFVIQLTDFVIMLLICAGAGSVFFFLVKECQKWGNIFNL